MFEDITNTLSHEADDDMLLTPSANREAQIDVDGVLYAIAKPYKASLEKDVEACSRYVKWLTHVSGSAFAALHTTQALKGGREQMAFHFPYQSKRHGYQDDVYMDRIRDLRRAFVHYTAENMLSLPQFFVEADDSMTERHNNRILTTKDYNSSIIITADKDLDMNCGMVMNTSTQRVTHCGSLGESGWEGTWGHVEFKRTAKSSKRKMTGRGMAFFWAQMLAGDKADTIKGLHSLPRDIVQRYAPTKKRGSAEKLCGESLAVAVISQCGNEMSAYRVVREAYGRYYGKWGDFFLFEMAYLLWMRRTTVPTDCLYYLNTLGFDYKLHPQQVSAISTYLERCKEVGV